MKLPLNKSGLQNKKILLTGARGRLGKELIPLLEEKGASIIAPTSSQWDIRERGIPAFLVEEGCTPDIVLHCGAYTDVAKAETERWECVSVNVVGTCNVAEVAKKLGAKMVHISSDYVTYNPKGHYALSKWMAEPFVPKTGMIIRTSFKSRGTWGKDALTGVFHPVFTHADFTDVIAEKIVKAIEMELIGVVNIGTRYKTLLSLAQRDYPHVDSIPVRKADEILGYHYPRSLPMNLTI